MNKGAFDPRRRLATPLSKLVVLSLFIFGWLVSAAPAQDSQPSAVLFKDVRVFDGKSAGLSGPTNVLVRGNKIEKISTAPIPVDPTSNTRIINGGGRTLMPGLIDMHWHAMMIRSAPAQAIAGDVGYNNIAAGAEATDTLLRGFTTVRDVGGPTFGLKQAIDEGVIAGPRIFPSGAIITITGGHGDFRQLYELPRTIGTLSRVEQMGVSAVADSPAGVRCIEHGFLMDEATARLIASKGVWLSPQPLPEELRQGFPVGSVQRAKADEVWPGIARTYELAKKYKIKTV